MIKAAGGIFIIYASFMVGHLFGQTQLRMVAELSELLHFIQMIKGQLSYAGCELPEIMESCEQRVTGTVKVWLTTLNGLLEEKSELPFAQIWTESMPVLEDLGALKPEMLSEVDRLGRALGDMDVDAQLAQIALIENSLGDRYNRERDRADGVNRLATSLGILGGLFLVLVLV